MKKEYTNRNPNEAFNQAIAEGRLTINLEDKNFAGDYMYMGTYNGRDSFKHCDSRKYDV